jgi:hypothetical protein
MSWRRNTFGLADGWRFGAALHDPISAIVSTVGNVVGGIIGADSADDAAQTQATAATQAAATQSDAAIRAAEIQQQAAREALDFQKQIYGETTNNLTPYGAAGKDALTVLMDQLGVLPGGNTKAGPLAGVFSEFQREFGAPPDAATFGQNFMSSPGYEWMKKEGLGAIENSAAARGGRVGGNTLKALQGYGTGLAQQDFWNQYGASNQNYWNRYNALNQDRQNYFNRLSGVAGMGQNAAVQQGGLGANLGTSGANALIGAGNAAAGGITGAANAGAAGIIGAGNANAAGTIGSANALSGAFGGAGNNLMLAHLLGRQNSWSPNTSLPGYGNDIGFN